MSTLHKIADDDHIWDSVYDETEFVGYDRSECGPLLRVVAAELRDQADRLTFLASVGEAGPNPPGVRMLKSVVLKLRSRADALDGGAS